MNISKDKILEIKQAVNLYDVVSESVSLKQAGKEYIGLCPFHDEKTGSFFVNPQKQLYYCFGCGASGDVFKFIMKRNGISFLEAVKQLAGKHGISLPEKIKVPVMHHGTPKPPEARNQKSEIIRREGTAIRNQRSDVGCQKQDAPPELWQEKASKLVSWSHDKLLQNPEQLKNLAKRGIKLETVKRFRLGWNPGKGGKDLFRPRESWGLPTEMKDNRKKKLWLPVGLIIPMMVHGHVHRLRVRRPTNSKPKYYIIPGSSMATWIMQQSKDVFVIVESELDGILLWQTARDITGVISLGAALIRPDVATIKLLQKSSWILNALDNDPAGAKAKAWWSNHFSQHQRWPVPAGKDPGEAWQEGVDLKKWIISGFPLAWRDGRFSFDSKKKGQNPFEKDKLAQDMVRTGEVDKVQPQSDSGSQSVKIKPTQFTTLQKLEKLLKQYPVKIYNSFRQISIQEDLGWVNRNPEASKKISNLVFMTPDIFEYICKHPARIITGDNLIH